MRAFRLTVTAASFAGLSIVTDIAHADVPPDACSTAYARGHEERLAGRLFNARRAFLECGAAQCPPSISGDCRRWTHEVEADLPTIRVTVTDERGQPIQRLEVFADGERIAPSALNSPIILEAGPHELRFEAPGYETLRIEKALRPSDREVDVRVTLRPPAAPVRDDARVGDGARGIPALSVALTSVGALSLAAAIYFGVRAKNEYDDLKRTCAPNCRDADADAMYNKAIVSNVALITSLVAFGGATYFYFSSRSASRPQAAVSVEPRADGVQVGLRASF